MQDRLHALEGAVESLRIVETDGAERQLQLAGDRGQGPFIPAPSTGFSPRSTARRAVSAPV